MAVAKVETLKKALEDTNRTLRRLITLEAGSDPKGEDHRKVLRNARHQTRSNAALLQGESSAKGRAKGRGSDA